MKFSTLQKKTTKELEKLVAQNKTKLRQIKFDVSSGKNKSADDVSKTKKDIPRILTKINQSEPCQKDS